MQAKRALWNKTNNGRPTAKGERNLFKGIAYEITDAEPAKLWFNDRKNGSTIYLENTDKKSRKFPYGDFEAAFLLGWLRHLPLEQLKDRSEQNKADALQSLRYQKDELDKVIKQQKEKMRGAGYSDALADAAAQTQRDRDALIPQIERLEADLDKSPRERAALLTKAVKQLFDAEKPDDALREHIKSLLAETVERIDCHFERVKHGHYTAEVAIYLRGESKAVINIGIRSYPDTLIVFDASRIGADTKPNLMETVGYKFWKTEKAWQRDKAAVMKKIEQLHGKKMIEKVAKKIKDGFTILEIAN